MTAPTYCELAVLKSDLGISATTKEFQLAAALAAASRSIDNYCHQRFWLDPEPVTRPFVAADPTCIDLAVGIGDPAGVLVESDPTGDGTFPVSWASTDFELLPVGAPYAVPDPEPWTTISIVGSLRFPVPGSFQSSWSSGRSDRVRITARWGWPAVPDPVVQACRIKAARLYFRKDSPQGIAGFNDFGPVRLSRSEDADVVLLLDPYRTVVIA